MAQALVAFLPSLLQPFAKNGHRWLSAALDRSRIALFLATAGLVAIGGGCARVPSGDGGPGPSEMGKPALAPPAVPAAPKPAATKHAGEGGEGGEG
jgi:hypothetical protein